MLSFALVAGCAGSIRKDQVVPPGTLVELAEDEGLLVIQIDTDVPLEDVRLTAGSVAQGLPKGQYIWVIRVPARRYAWQQIDMGSEAGIDGRYKMSDVELLHEGEFEFEVVPKSINYPGELIIRSDPFDRSSGRRSIRNRNHSAMAIRRLRKTHASLIDAFPIRYAGWSGDGFLDFFTRERQSIPSSNESKEKP